ncbi:MAG: ribonuclease HII [Desulfurivibrionaceae bacterium]|nr:ribonuclease HII [Desulfobulbales bacterium]MDT8335540.1 ribonuclease HII [Desulfurivibrionaceae bacterium]
MKMAECPKLFTAVDFVETDSFAYERELFRQGIGRVAGTDEAGRGPLAGPVVAACVVLPAGCDFTLFKDSKQLSAVRRARLHELLLESGAEIGVGCGTVADIDRINILRASLLAMKRAVAALADMPDFLLVDGKFPVPLFMPQQSLVKGESRSASIAAASIVAKQERDRLMEGYHRQYPRYNFARHKGYPTAEHRRLLEKHGPCAIHRRAFKGVREHWPRK